MREESVRVIRSLEGLRELRSMWDAIPLGSLSPMETHDWVRVWAEVCRAEGDLEVVVAGSHPSIAIAPLVRAKGAGERLELASSAALGEAMDFVYSDPASVDVLVQALARSGRPLRLWRIPADSAVVEALKRAYRWRGIVRVGPSPGCPSLPLDETWVNPEEHLDRHQRSNIRRARRMAEAMGLLTWEILSPRPADVDPILREAYEVEARGWKGQQGSSLIHDAVWGQFFRQYASAASERGALRICFLRIDGRPAAMKLGAVTGNRFWLLATGYSEEFARCSPGTLLLLETIRYAARSGLRSYEFLGADEPWIRVWTSLLRPCVSLRTYPISLRGSAALASDVGAAVRRRALRVGGAVRPVSNAIKRHMALGYVAGPDLEDAVRVCRSLEARGFRSTIGYVDAPDDAPRTVARRHVSAIEAIGRCGIDSGVSVKAPLLRFSGELFHELADRAKRWDIDLQFDSMAAEDVDATFSVIKELSGLHSSIGCTIPGRWRRSIEDADRAIDLDLGVRIVKGEWVARKSPEVKPIAGFLAVVDRIAGRVRHASVATHDPALAREALQRLRSAGTPSELEVLMGYPIHRVIPVAMAAGVAVRVYVPFGNLALPYSMREVRKNPRMIGWAVRDLGRGPRSDLIETRGVRASRAAPARSRAAESRSSPRRSRTASRPETSARRDSP